MDQVSPDPLAALRAALVGERRPFKNVSELANELTKVWPLTRDGKPVHRLTLNSRLTNVFTARLSISNTLEEKIIEATTARLQERAASQPEIERSTAELRRLFEACSVAWALSKRSEPPPGFRDGVPPVSTPEAVLLNKADTWILGADVQGVGFLLRTWSSNLAEASRPPRLTLLVRSRTDAAVAWQQLGLVAARALDTDNPDRVISKLAELEEVHLVRVAIQDAAWPCNIVLQSPLGETPTAHVQTIDRGRLAQIPYMGTWRDFCIEVDLKLAGPTANDLLVPLSEGVVALAAVVRAITT